MNYGRPTQVTVSANVDGIHFMIQDDQRISTKNITETLAISRETVGYIFYEILDKRKLSVQWVPKCLNAGGKLVRVLASQAILDYFRPVPEEFFLNVS
jgi:hypothetical protein